MPDACVIDTTILQKANAPLLNEPRARALFRKRLQLLNDIDQRRRTVLKSDSLVKEYEDQVGRPRNDFVKAFMELILGPSGDRVHHNWKTRWSGADREKSRKCRFPREDDHVLRTAIRSDSVTTIFTEEDRMLRADECIYRAFRVHIRGLP